MASRPAWKGYLKLSLVTCAVELFNATSHTDKVTFRILNRATGNTVKRIYVDEESGKPVEEKDEVKGYETGSDEFLLIEEDDIEAVQIESSHTLNVDRFVKASEIEQFYLDTPYYAVPADEVSAEAFTVIREALDQKKMAGLARIVLYRREHPVVIEPRGKGMLLTTLRYDSTVRRPETIFDDLKEVKIDDEMIDMATRVIDRKKTKFDPSKFEDRYEEALRKLIAAKKKGKKPPAAKAEPKKSSNVVNLFDALKKSLESEGKSGAGRFSARKKGASTAAKKRKSA